MKRLLAFYSNLRIGTKIAISSILALSILLIVAVTQMIGANMTDTATAAVIRRTSAALYAAETKGALRGMQIGVRDMRLANSAEELKKAHDYLDKRYESTQRYINQAMASVIREDQKNRLRQALALAEVYMRGAAEVADVRAAWLAAHAKDAAADVSPFEVKLAALVREKTLPTAVEMEKTINEFLEIAHGTAKVAAREAVEVATLVGGIGLGLTIIGALVLIGSIFLLVTTISKPMRSLTGGMLELADGNFDVCCRVSAARTRSATWRRRSKPSR